MQILFYPLKILLNSSFLQYKKNQKESERIFKGQKRVNKVHKKYEKILRENIDEKFVTFNALDPFVLLIGYFTFARLRNRIAFGYSIGFRLSIMTTPRSTASRTPI